MKKLIPVLFVILLLSTTVLAAEANELYGDVNYDEVLDAKDYMALKRHILGTYRLNWFQYCEADANLDGEVNARDYITLKLTVLGKYKQTVPAWSDDLTDDELMIIINARLAKIREEGQISFRIDPAVQQQEEIAAILEAAGLPGDWENSELYTDVYNTDGYSFTIIVPEEEIRAYMFRLCRTEHIIRVVPVYLDLPA